jgi:hypothetical protein
MTANKIHELDVTPHEGEHRVPLAWLLFAGGLVVWGAYYLWTYSPALGGWSQGQALADEATLPGTTIFATVLFTVLAALVAGGILFTVALRKKE